MQAMINCRTVDSARYAVEALCSIGISAYRRGANVYYPMAFARDNRVWRIWEKAIQFNPN